MRSIIFIPECLNQYLEWEKVDKKIFQRINLLLDDIRKHPYSGIGKPEPLKYELKGFWSRRIDKKHRLVYKVTDDAIIVYSCKYHY